MTAKARPVKDGLYVTHPLTGLRLLGSRCSHCGELFFPRKGDVPCVRCQTQALTDIELGPYGRIDSFSAALQPPAGGFYRGRVPYCYGLVDLDEGLRVLSRLAGEYASLAPGMRVRLQTEDLHADAAGDTVQAFCFAPCAEEAAT